MSCKAIDDRDIGYHVGVHTQLYHPLREKELRKWRVQLVASSLSEDVKSEPYVTNDM